MKSIHFIKTAISVIFIVLFHACNDSYLERYPLSELTPETYFQDENELKTFTNSFYDRLPDALDVYFYRPHCGDDEARTVVASEFQGNRTVPTVGGGWSWSALRKINFYLENSHKCKDEAARLKYDGVARFFRAYFYFNMIIRFGDVPWYDKVIGSADNDLFKARDTREYVFERILEDINFAIEHCSVEIHPQLVTKWTALALKSRMCLFEGTFRKYHGLNNYDSILDECIKASEELIASNKYTIYKSSPSNPNKAYHELFIQEETITDEIILARQYSINIPYTHSVNFYTLTASYEKPSITKSFVDSYLMADGSRFTDIPGYKTMQFYEETRNRDPRMAQTIRIPGYKRIGEDKISVPDFTSCLTGYQYIKYILESKYDNGNCTNDIPLFRYAEVLLNYAEAKAEKGSITQSDIDKSIKLLRERVAMPTLNMEYANNTPDPYLEAMYPNVDKGINKGVILEIRRERRVELVREGFRYNDILRWKEGKIFEKPFYGMYFPGVGEYDLDRNGTIDLVIYSGKKPRELPGRQYQSLNELSLEDGENGGRIVTNPLIPKTWDENKDYFYPIPIQELQLNPNLTQNPYWNDGKSL